MDTIVVAVVNIVTLGVEVAVARMGTCDCLRGIRVGSTGKLLSAIASNIRELIEPMTAKNKITLILLALKSHSSIIRNECWLYRYQLLNTVCIVRPQKTRLYLVV